MKEYNTLADLQSSRQANTGLMMYCRENLRYYIVQADGYSPAAGDITFSNGRYGKLVNIADAEFIKTTNGNVQSDINSIVAGGLPSQAGNAGRVLSTDGNSAFWSSIAEKAITPEDFGAVGDGSTDDTAALQAAIDAAKGSGSLGLPTSYVYLAAKTYRHTGLVIDRAVAVLGADRNATRLKCLSTANPAITVRLGFDVGNYQTAGRMGPTVALKNVLIEGEKTFPSANNGIEVDTPASNAIRGWVYLEDCDIHAMGGNAIFGNAWEGAVKALNCKFINNAGKQLSATSCADWQFIGCEFGVTSDDNILLSGCAAFTFTTCNIYSSTGDLVTLFTDAAATAPVNHHFVSCSFDRSSEGHGVVYNVRNDGNVTFSNCYWTKNGQGTVETYSDIWIDASVGRGPTIVGGWMEDPSASDSLYNIFFNGSGSSCFTTNVQFEAGNARSANVTNSIAQLKFEGAENFATAADLAACTWCEDGDNSTCVERANAQYVLAASGYTALAGDITAANGRVWALQIDGWMNIECFGAKQSVDSTSEIQAAFDRAEFVYAIGFDYRYTQLTVSSSLKFIGAGKKKTRLRTTNLVDDKILVTANGSNSVIFADMELGTIGTQTGGAYIRFDSASTQLQCPVVSGCNFISPYTGIYLANAAQFKISGNYFVTYINAGVVIENTIEPDSGDSSIDGGNVFDAGGDTGDAIVQLSSGGLRVVNNKFLNGAYHYRANFNSTPNTSILCWTGNSSEQARTANIAFNATTPSSFSYVNISGGNQFSVRDSATAILINDPGYNFLSSSHIEGNIFNLASNAKAMNIGRLQNSTIGRNTIIGNGTGETGLQVGANSSGLKISQQTMVSVATEYTLAGSYTVTDWEVESGSETGSTDNAFGSLHVTPTIAVTFSKAYPVAPKVQATTVNSSGGVSSLVSNVTTTGFALNIVGLNSAATVTTNWTATL